MSNRYVSQSPIVVVPSIEDVLGFYCDVLGFDEVDRLERDHKLSYIVLQRDGVEIMLQSTTSLRNESPDMAARLKGQPVVLTYIDVDDVEALYAELSRDANAEVAVPLRQMPHGLEFYLRDPMGHLVGFTTPGSVR